jgi:hypothetical protein
MHYDRAALVALLMILPMVDGCSKQADTPAPTSSAAPTSTSAPSEADIKKMVADQNKPQPTACTLVTPQEMSAILGSTVTAEPHEGTVDQTECIFKPANAPSPYIELTVNYGDGEAAMGAATAMNHVEPGITNPYAGIGDQAVAVGTALMIRTGEDLVTITFSGVDDAPAKVRKIFDIAKPRMQP